MRRLKDHSGLSLAALSTRTTYSKSSWERYLNGKKLPPREAVEELARVTGTDPTRLFALYEVAQSASGTEAEPAAGTDGTAVAEGAKAAAVPDAAGGADAEERDGAALAAVPDPPASGVPAGRRGVGWLLAGVGAGLVLGLTALFVMAPWHSEAAAPPQKKNSLVTAHQKAFPAHPRGRVYRCEIQQHDGRTYAGHSATRRKVIEINSIGWEVVEAQCLLREAGFPPGAADGIYGENTENAVKRLQKKAGIADDGAVGPDTWKALRS